MLGSTPGCKGLFRSNILAHVWTADYKVLRNFDTTSGCLSNRMGKTIQAVSLIVTHSADESPQQPVTPAAVPPQPAARRSKLRLSSTAGASSAGARPAGPPPPDGHAGSMAADCTGAPVPPSQKQTNRSLVPFVCQGASPAGTPPPHGDASLYGGGTHKTAGCSL